MAKGPVFAIIASIILTLSIFLFTDIRPQGSEVLNQEEATEKNIPSQDEEGAFSYISSYNNTLDENEKTKINFFITSLEEEYSIEQKINLVDSIILFYETKQQYNFSAWYHSTKAGLLGNSDSWTLAGERQYSVSQNNAYNADFNFLLRAEAIASFNKAIEIDSTNNDAKVQLAACYLEDEAQTMQGITLLLAVVKEDSLHINANILLGKYGIVSAQYDKAVQRLENVVSLQPDNTEALFLLAEAYNGLGNKSKAIDTFKKCQSLVENEALKLEIQDYIDQLSL